MSSKVSTLQAQQCHVVQFSRLFEQSSPCKVQACKGPASFSASQAPSLFQEWDSKNSEITPLNVILSTHALIDEGCMMVVD